MERDGLVIRNGNQFLRSRLPFDYKNFRIEACGQGGADDGVVR